MDFHKDFRFKFQPYDIQEKFMKELYAVLTNKQFGIFESRKFFFHFHSKASYGFCNQF